jgi:hypothetical protein
MAIINIESHDILGKLSIIKNALSVAMENQEKEKFIQIALVANQELIELVKKATENGKNSNC